MLACVSGHTITRLGSDVASLGRVSGHVRRSGTHQTHRAGRKNEISHLAVHSDLASLLLREGVVKARCYASFWVPLTLRAHCANESTSELAGACVPRICGRWDESVTFQMNKVYGGGAKAPSYHRRGQGYRHGYIEVGQVGTYQARG